MFSMRPISLAATQVYDADSWMLVSTSTLRPMDSGGVSSTEPRRHLTYGIGEPMATQVRLVEPPGITSTLSGGNEKCGALRITAIVINNNARKCVRISLWCQSRMIDWQSRDHGFESHKITSGYYLDG